MCPETTAVSTADFPRIVLDSRTEAPLAGVPGPLDHFGQLWAVDFEFSAPPGQRPTPTCLAARELRTGQIVRLFGDELLRRRTPPYPVGPDSLFIAFYASAELGCHLALGWPMPARILDVFVEFRNATAGLKPPHGNGLLGALAWYGLDFMEAIEKEQMRALIMRGAPFSEVERRAILDYCELDVAGLARLLAAMVGEIDLPRALLRGRYMAAAAKIEWQGVPIDIATLTRLREHWADLKVRLIGEIDRDYGVFENGVFRADRWARWLLSRGIPWPALESGALALDDDTFRDLARVYPEVALMRELRHALSQLRLADLAVGSDGRNRCLLSAFGSKTGRNQPSNSRFIFGPSTWLRGLIKPTEGNAVAYIDWEQQEFGIAAALSGDIGMREAYLSGDPYLAFGKQAGRIPMHGTKDTHAAIRNLFKGCVLGVQYGMGEVSLARRIGLSPAHARELLQLHHLTYPDYWKWSDAAEQHAMIHGRLWTVFGWAVHVGSAPNPRSLRNFLMQANGAEMLRMACCLCTERGISVCAPIHDALLVEGSIEEIDDIVARTQAAMEEASTIVLDGFALRSDAKIVRWPDRYMDARGRQFWDRVFGLLGGPV